MRLAFSVGALTAVCLLIPASASADPGEAKIHYARAKSYFELRDYRHALEEFKAAHVEKSDPAFLFNIAECHRLLGERGDAVFFYKRFLLVTPPGGKLRADAEARIAEIEKGAAAPATAGASPANQPAAPAPAALAPPEPGGAAPASSAVAASPTAPPSPQPATGAPLLSQSAEPKPGGTASRKTAAYVVGGVAVGALVAGGIFGWRAISKRHDSDTQCPDPMGRCTQQAVDWNEQAKTAARVSDVAFGAGLAGAVVATYLLLTSGGDSATLSGPAHAIHVAPEVGPTQAGLALGGSW